MKLSVIVPVYNVEQYLLRCLNSLYMQDLEEEEFEVILVNDGSTDKSLDVARTFALQHNNVVVINQGNSGQSAARNSALNVSKGDYIWFVDSDDYVVPHSIKKLLALAYENQLDIVGFNLQLVHDDGRIEDNVHQPSCEGQLLSGEDFVVDAGMPHGPCFALFSRAHLNKYNLHFLEGVVHEDVEFVLRTYFLAHRAVYYNEVVYSYYQRKGSTMKSNNPLRAQNLLLICDSLYNFCKSNINKNTKAYYFFMKEIMFLFSQSLFFFEKTNTLTLKNYSSKEYYPFRDIKCCSIKEMIKVFIMNRSLSLYKQVVRLI